MLAIKSNAGFGHVHVSHGPRQTQNSALIGAVSPVLGAVPRALQRPHSVFSSEFTADCREKKYDSIVTLGWWRCAPLLPTLSLCLNIQLVSYLTGPVGSVSGCCRWGTFIACERQGVRERGGWKGCRGWRQTSTQGKRSVRRMERN